MAPLSKFLESGPTLTLNEVTADTMPDGTQLLNRLAVLVGLVAVGLPIILWFGANVAGSCMRYSISHFYYAQFLGPAFVGLLFFIGGFLIAYTGEHWLENWGSNLAGLGAFGVAMFPTSGTGCNEAEFLSRVFVTVTNGDPITVAIVPGRGFFELFGQASSYHGLAAGALFTYLGLYCLFVLKRVVPTRHQVEGVMIQTKANRNRVYSYCGIIILICVAALAIKTFFGGEFVDKWNALSLTFYVETVALWAFGLAWFVKGRIFSALND